MEKEYYKEYYILEKDYWVFTARRKIALSILGRYLRQGARRPDILDAGTGTGVMLGELGRFGNATGLDNSRDAIEFCGKRGFSNVVEGSAESLPFSDSSFDAVCAMDILEHLKDDRRALAEFFRVLRPGGVLFITVPAFMFLWGPHDEINMHKRRYVPRQVAERIKEAGFVTGKLSYFNCFFFPAVVFIRVARRVLSGGRLKPKSDLISLPALPNKVLELVFSSERFMLKYFNLPFGVSVLCAAMKPTG